MAAARARRTGNREKVTFQLYPHAALVIAGRLEQTEYGMQRFLKMDREVREIAGSADDAMKDHVLRFNYAAMDLEMLLMQFIGRPPMTMQEVREQQVAIAPRNPKGPQPFLRKQPAKPPSAELLNSIRSGKIGDPREPGQDG